MFRVVTERQVVEALLQQVRLVGAEVDAGLAQRHEELLHILHVRGLLGGRDVAHRRKGLELEQLRDLAQVGLVELVALLRLHAHARVRGVLAVLLHEVAVFFEDGLGVLRALRDELGEDVREVLREVLFLELGFNVLE